MSTSERASHELFQRYPLTERTLSGKAVPFPYHVYDGSVFFIGGTANFAAAKTLLQDQSLSLVQTDDGKALMALWVCNFTSASLGAHHELQVSFFVSAQPLPPVPNQPLTLLKLVSLHPEVKMLCFDIWNDDATVVAYNRELFGLDAHSTTSTINISGGRANFRFADAASSDLLLEGHIAVPASQPGKESFALMRTLGFLNTMKVARAPYVSLQVVNPIGSIWSEHKAAQTYTKSDKQIIRFFDPATDALALGARYQSLSFAPQFASISQGVRFLYLEPQPLR